LNVWGAIDQAKENCPNGSDPVLIMKKNGRDAHAVIHMDVFFDLILSKHHPTIEETPQETKPETVNITCEPQEIKRPREEGSEEIRNEIKRFVKKMNELLEE
jgi:hypothetical protein